MTDRDQIIRSAADSLQSFGPSLDRMPVTVGFDGFVDSIIDVVDKRHSVDDYDPMQTIEQFGRRILAAAGHSANYELAVKLQKLGGNGPIMANALAAFGLPVTYIGALGYPKIHPVFEELADAATCHSISEPGFTDCLEFTDGKLMLGKHATIRDVGPPRIDEVLGAAKFAQIVSNCRLLGMVNWTMLTATNDIWRRLIDDVLPRTVQRQLIFVDLADPEKRTPEDLSMALNLMAEMQANADVVLGVNLKESVQVARVLEIDPTDQPKQIIEDLAASILEVLSLHGVVIHPRETAAAAVRKGEGVETGYGTAPFTKTPRLSTGAGDNFNAGFCLGLLAEMPVPEAVAVANAASGFYVRNARSGNVEEVADFCATMPEPELD